MADSSTLKPIIQRTVQTGQGLPKHLFLLWLKHFGIKISPLAEKELRECISHERKIKTQSVLIFRGPQLSSSLQTYQRMLEHVRFKKLATIDREAVLQLCLDAPQFLRNDQTCILATEPIQKLGLIVDGKPTGAQYIFKVSKISGIVTLDVININDPGVPYIFEPAKNLWALTREL
jgi:hypothetical protein